MRVQHCFKVGAELLLCSGLMTETAAGTAGAAIPP